MFMVVIVAFVKKYNPVCGGRNCKVINDYYPDKESDIESPRERLHHAINGMHMKSISRAPIGTLSFHSVCWPMVVHEIDLKFHQWHGVAIPLKVECLIRHCMKKYKYLSCILQPCNYL